MEIWMTHSSLVLFACHPLRNLIQIACQLANSGHTCRKRASPALERLLTPWLVRVSISFSMCGHCCGHSRFIISTVIRDSASLMWLSSSRIEWVPWKKSAGRCKMPIHSFDEKHVFSAFTHTFDSSCMAQSLSWTFSWGCMLFHRNLQEKFFFFSITDAAF